ncbi:Telomeric repeat-binding factor 2 [compost metagenome]
MKKIAAIFTICLAIGIPMTMILNSTSVAKEDKISTVFMEESLEIGTLSMYTTHFSTKPIIRSTDNTETKANGTYWIIPMHIQNNGGKSQVADTLSFKIITPDGTEYEPNVAAIQYLDDKGTAFTESIVPGEEAKGYVIFDVPQELLPYTCTLQITGSNADSGTIFLTTRN